MTPTDTSSDAPASGLPRPTRGRWEPLRAGLVDLYYYDQQEFWFHDGRLLLRGNNGAGKSKVLALLLPFLFDGETAGHRLEPDGDPAKRMEWNLLLGGEHDKPERTGYSWLELGRVDEDGVERHCTIGFGAKAVKGRPQLRKWFFTTSELRVGVDLHLVDATRTVLTQERLTAALDALHERGAGHGRVTTTATAHRAAVDQLLFGLGEQRYTALVDLLVQLRQPQLSKKPSEERLSAALTAALPPLDPAVLAAVADSYRSLDEDRAALERSRDALAGARAFLGHYRSYTQVAARRAAEPPRLAQGRYERSRTALSGAHEERQRTHAAAADAVAAESAAAERVEVVRARELALAGDPRHRAVEVIQEVRRADEAARREHVAAGERADAAGRRREDSTRRSERAEQEAQQSAERVRHAADRVDVAGAAAGLPRVGDLGQDDSLEVAGVVGPLDVAAPPTDTGPWRRAAQHALQRRLSALDHLDGLAREHDRASVATRRATDDADRAQSALSAAEERTSSAVKEQDDAGAALVAATATWTAQLVELQLLDPAALLAEVEAWRTALQGESPLLGAASSARAAATGRLALERGHLQQEAAQAGAQAEALSQELAALERGQHTPPVAPPTRDPASREGVPGAPLWQLVEPAPGLSSADTAGLEAALEGAGLLDAFVGADSTLRLTDDVVLHPPVLVSDGGAGRTLADVLLPGPSQAVDGDVVLAVLRGVALGAPDAGARQADDGPSLWVDVDGSFGTPVTTGSWHRERSEHLGANARERRRLARMAQVRGELAEAEQRRFDAEDAADRLLARLEVAAREAAAVPSAQPVLRAAQSVAERTRERDERRDEAQRTEGARHQAVAAQAAAAAAVQAAAEQLDLPAGSSERTAVRSAVQQWERGLDAFWSELAALVRVRALARERAGEAAREAEAAEAAEAERAERRRAAAAAAERLSTMERAVGADAEEFLAESEHVRDEVEATAGAQRTAAQAVREAAAAQGAADDRVASLTEVLADHTAERDAAVVRWQAFAQTGVLAVAVPELELPASEGSWAPDSAVRVARALEQALDAVSADDDALTRAQNRVTLEQRELDDVLALDGHRASLRTEGDGPMLVDVDFRGQRATLVELEAELATDVEARTALLDADERRVIENYLVDEVASSLADLVAGAEAQLERMNTELRARPTSTGMRLRLRWLPREDGPRGLAAARERLLRQHADAWTATDRAAVAEFLTAQVQAARAADPGGSWLEQLSTALDYRAWHRFAVQRWTSGQWRSAAGPASGGERVLAASVPLFAAAAAHYSSAPSPHAPRLVMLDEAFAGVDDTARASYLGLLAEFDLDVVMTSEREWGCYASVPGLGIAQLSRVEGVDAVLVTPWRWDGRVRSRMDGDLAMPAPRREAPPEHDQDGLFDA